jgi:DNA-binding transcriptional ArsR family regulator
MAERGTKKNDTRRKVEELLAQGKKQAEIARELGLSRPTVCYHYKQIRLEENKKKAKDENKAKSKPRGRKIEWPVYNEQRVMRGECVLALDVLEDEKKQLEEMNFSKMGRKFQYSDILVEAALRIKITFKVSYAMLEGILRKILPSIGLQVPDYSTICKRAEKLSEKICVFSTPAEEGSEDAEDSTGRSQSLRGSYRESKYDIQPRKYLKLCVQIDTETLEAKAFVVEESNSADIKNSAKLMEESQKYGKIKKVYKDRGYDSASHRAELILKGIEPVIRPRIYGSLQENKERLEKLQMEYQESSSEGERRKLLGAIHRLKAVIECSTDYEKWREKTGYGKRAMVENFFSRDMMIFDDRIFSKKINKARVEMAIRISFLNAFIRLRRCSTKAEANQVKDLVIKRLAERNQCKG